jgi:hypothetical protein
LITTKYQLLLDQQTKRNVVPIPKKISALVDTGIISFETAWGGLNWMTETFKKMMDIR